ncbi:3-hydroxyacyl-CoA dehydrogenase NAD-binding domain-containing protein [Rhizorhapis sp. SPR117]|uniref:3-hydroxyacyl-CoA dehydrogenase NAD-binding domain-containing protein n=1 Tax=Rhizorhapis sp. SPR117 TaxID=2912611 RepID=UPI001F2B00C4|nr:3-hydroxyacyl-CoA dehydrogenase NAD-binding domain-containing protein [Rhizorhapis sp. SPR117]
MNQDFTTEIDSNGVALITWDARDTSMNVFDDHTFGQFEEAIEAVLANPDVKGAVITSGKSSFSAGGKLDRLGRMMSPNLPEQDRVAAIMSDVTNFQRLLRRIETGGKPFVAAINGLALGGGLELCLACHYRIASDAPKLVVGLPEAKMGLLPGAGGTQRSLRMMGADTALPLILEGRTLNAEKAKAAGWIDEIAPAAELISAAKNWVLSAGPDAAVKPWDKPGFVPPGPDPRTAAGGIEFSMLHGRMRGKNFDLYPALNEIERIMYEGWAAPFDRASALEARAFARLALSPVTRNIIRTQFVNMQKANKLERRPAGVPRSEIRKVGVLGAGMMGAAIAHVCALSGLDVVLIDQDQANADHGREHARRYNARGLATGAVKEAAVQATIDRIQATTDFSALSDVQIVVEAVFEDKSVKQDVIRRSEQAMPADAIFATNTSTIPISELAEFSSRPERFIGTHFFSPAEKMQLVEVITGRQSGDEALAIAMDFSKRIGKTPIVVSDSRGFYTSRVFETYFHEAVRMLVEGVEPARIESAGRHIGMPMPPLAILDEISLELVEKVHSQTARDLGDAFEITPAVKFIAHMVKNEGRLGKKIGKGIYDYSPQGGKTLWPGLAKLAPIAPHQPDHEEVKLRLLTIQAVDTARCLEEGVLRSAADADVGSLLGWSFASWTGGPLSYIDMVGVPEFVARCDRMAQEYGPRFAPGKQLRKMAENEETYYPATDS